MLKFGVGLPSYVKRDGTPIGPDRLGEFAKEAECLGFDSLWIFEQLLKAEPYHLTTWMEPIIVAAAVAQATNKIDLATVVVLPRREPVLLAKTLASLDVLSSGRLLLIAGTGSEAPEFRAQGVSMKGRGKKTEEMILLMRKLWKESDVTFQGDFFKVEKINIEPKPVKGDIPILIAGGTHADPEDMKRRVKYWNPDIIFRRIARLGDGFVTPPSAIVRSTEYIEKDWQTISKYTREAGRDPSKLERAHLTFCYLGRNSDTDFAERAKREVSNFTGVYQKNFLIGRVEELAPLVAGWIRAGINHTVLSPINDDIDQLRILGEELIPRVRELI